MPTSITAAPGATMSRGHELRHAHGGHEHVGPAAVRGEVARARVAVRDGGVRGQQQRGSGLPDELRAADHHRLRARAARCRRRAAAPSRPPACTGTSPGVPCMSRPAFTGVSPSTSLSGSISRDHRVAVDLRRHGSWSRMPCTASSAFSSAISSASSSWVVSAGSSWWNDVHARLARTPCACCARRSARRGRRPRGSWRARAACRAARRAPRPRARTRSRTSCGDRLAVDDAARSSHASSLLQRRVVRHQLALGAVGGEAHDTRPPGSSPVTTPSPSVACTTSSPTRERGARLCGCGGRGRARRRRSRPSAAARPTELLALRRSARPGSRRGSGSAVPVARAVEGALARVGHVELAHARG